MKVFLSPKVVLTDRDCAQVDLDFVFIAAALYTILYTATGANTKRALK